MKEDIATSFYLDPLEFMDRGIAAIGDVVRTGEREFLLGNATDARSVLRNDEGRYREHSDFFHTRYGVLAPRSTQLKIRRQSRAFLRAHLEQRAAGDLAAFLEANLASTSDWPDTGNWLAYRYLAPALLAPDSPPKLRRLLDEIVQRSVLADAKSRQPRWRRMLLQFKTTLTLSDAIERRLAFGRAEPIDLLDVVAMSGEPGQRADELAEVYLSFLFAIAGSVGFVLAWSLYLLGTHPRRDVPPQWVVQEALRLWPVAWQLGRHPTMDHELSGVKVAATDEVVVCPYLVQRNPEHWSEPTVFKPERWADPEAWRNLAFIPFGYGPHRCVAADLSTQLVSEMLGLITSERSLIVTVEDTRPTVAAAMAPPAFSLTVRPIQERFSATAARSPQGAPRTSGRMIRPEGLGVNAAHHPCDK
jgi:cytochrome P450